MNIRDPNSPTSFKFSGRLALFISFNNCIVTTLFMQLVTQHRADKY